jgi:recombination protein RecT
VPKGELIQYRQSVERWEKILDRVVPKLADVLPAHIPPKRLHRILLAQFTPDSKIHLCTPASFVGSVLTTCQIGLEIAVGGQCWILPFKKKDVHVATLVVGWKGYKDLAYRTPQVATFNAHVVYEDEEFQYHRAMGAGESPHILHPLDERPPAEKGHLRAAYMAVQMKSGHWVLHVLSKPEILERKRRSKAAQYQTSAWASDEAAMWRKTACLAGSAFLPADYNFARAADLDSEAERGVQDLSKEPREFGIDPDQWEDAAGEHQEAASAAKDVGEGDPE